MRPETREEYFKLIDAEREKQAKMWHGDDMKQCVNWMAILTHETGELLDKDTSDGIDAQLIKIASVAIAALESRDVQRDKLRVSHKKNLEKELSGGMIAIYPPGTK